MAVGGYDGMHLIYEALKKTGGKTDGDSLIEAMKGMSWESPRGPISIDPQTRDIVQNIYIRKVEKKNGELYNVEFATVRSGQGPGQGLGAEVRGNCRTSPRDARHSGRGRAPAASLVPTARAGCKGLCDAQAELPTALSRMNMRIGTKLAITVGIGVVLVAGMIVNQQLSNTSVARQTELARDEQFVISDLLSASVALQRMQVGTREIRLAISEREADQALAGLRESMGNAVSYIQAAIQLCGNAENCERLESLVKLAKDYAAAAAEMTALKKDYGDITKPLDQINKIGTRDQRLDREGDIRCQGAGLSTHDRGGGADDEGRANQHRLRIICRRSF